MPRCWSLLDEWTERLSAPPSECRYGVEEGDFARMSSPTRAAAA
jgi:hypothetical protein